MRMLQLHKLLLSTCVHQNPTTVYGSIKFTVTCTCTTGDEAFAPTLEDIKVFVEYQEDRKPQEPVVWSSMQFTLLGLFDQQVRWLAACATYIHGGQQRH